MHVIAVTFSIHPAQWEAFLPLMQANAAASLRDEPGCLQFDVCTGPDHTVFLYEVYTDEAAFGAHLQTPHFKSFDAAVAEMIAVKDVRAYTRL